MSSDQGPFRPAMWRDSRLSSRRKKPGLATRSATRDLKDSFPLRDGSCGDLLAFHRRLFLFVVRRRDGVFLLVHGLERENLEALHAARNLNGHLLSLPATRESFADGRSDGNVSPGHVRIFRENQLVADLSLFIQIVKNHGGSQPHAILGERVQPDHRDLTQALLELPDLGLYIALSLQRRVVFGVLTQISHGQRPLDLLGKFVPVLSFESLKLLLQPSNGLLEHCHVTILKTPWKSTMGYGTCQRLAKSRFKHLLLGEEACETEEGGGPFGPPFGLFGWEAL